MRIPLLSIHLLLILVSIGCKPSRPEITLACSEDKLKNYQVKWDIYPQIEGIAQIYRSDSPTDFSKSQLVTSVNIAEGTTPPIIAHCKKRSYFRVVFNDQFAQTVATRVLNINGVNNFRDIGGYENRNKEYVKWGTIYRSGYLNHATNEGTYRVNSLNIKTALDFRNSFETKPLNTSDIKFQDTVICLSQWTKRDELMTKLKNGTFKRGDGIIYMQDCYLYYLNSEKEMTKKAFQTLADPNKFPIILISNLGKDQIGFITALLFKLVGVPEKTIINDYLISNEHISQTGLSKFINGISDDSLEGFAMLFSARPEYLQCIFKRIDENYGGINAYLTDYIGLTDKELKSIHRNIMSPRQR